ncbi:MAG: dethiobiotin synthase [Tatlockia sp.]
MNAFFITGTDTDCGKTYVTCQLLDYFKKHNQKALALKPVASGCVMKDGVLQSEDVLRLQHHNGNFPYPINAFKFAPPISPHLAAKEAHCTIKANDLAVFCKGNSFSGHDILLIEGAGGLMAPLNAEETWLDFLALTQIPAILVVGMRLGCLNHALLTDFALKTAKIPCLGWIANCLDKDMQALDANIDTLCAKMNSPLLGKIAYQGALSETSVLQKIAAF